MGSVRVIEAQDAALIDSGQMGQEKGEIVSSYRTHFIRPNFLTQDANAAGASKSCFVIRRLAKADLLDHGSNLTQVMH
jgi:hypothetical protein